MQNEIIERGDYVKVIDVKGEVVSERARLLHEDDSGYLLFCMLKQNLLQTNKTVSLEIVSKNVLTWEAS